MTTTLAKMSFTAILALILGLQVLDDRSLGNSIRTSNVEGVVATTSVRSQLERAAQQSGLAIAMFNFKGIGILDFRQRSFKFRKLPFKGNSIWGAVSRDGTKIAIAQTVTKPETISVVNSDGTDLREYSGIIEGTLMCWSYDNSQLIAVTPSDPPPGMALLELKGGQIERLPVAEMVTSQCWSPDGTKVVYQGKDDKILIYDLKTHDSTTVVSGTQPTWSPDGNWIACRDGEKYFRIQPNGAGKKVLFTRSRAVSGLYWSPDSQFVAYVHQDFFSLDTEFYHLFVRRLRDNAEEWVANGDDATGTNYQWILNKQIAQAQN